jgi:hypothetical protein
MTNSIMKSHSFTPMFCVVYIIKDKKSLINRLKTTQHKIKIHSFYINS